MEPRSYAEQEVVVEGLLRVKRDLSSKQLQQVYEIMFGQTLTASVIRRAKERLQREHQPVGVELGKTLLKPKERYLLALFSLYPDLPATLARARTKMHFQEDTRQDIVEEWRQRARVHPLSPADATAELNQAPQTTQPSFGLLDGEEPTA